MWQVRVTVSRRAAAAEADFAPLNGAPERAFGGVVGRFYTFLVEEGKESSALAKNPLRFCCCECPFGGHFEKFVSRGSKLMLSAMRPNHHNCAATLAGAGL
jgi:hypothetical protein